MVFDQLMATYGLSMVYYDISNLKTKRGYTPYAVIQSSPSCQPDFTSGFFLKQIQVISSYVSYRYRLIIFSFLFQFRKSKLQRYVGGCLTKKTIYIQKPRSNYENIVTNTSLNVMADEQNPRFVLRSGKLIYNTATVPYSVSPPRLDCANTACVRVS